MDFCRDIWVPGLAEDALPVAHYGSGQGCFSWPEDISYWL